MNTELLQDITATISRRHGLQVALAVEAAIRVADKRWQAEDTTAFGMLCQDIIREEDEQLAHRGRIGYCTKCGRECEYTSDGKKRGV